LCRYSEVVEKNVIIPTRSIGNSIAAINNGKDDLCKFLSWNISRSIIRMWVKTKSEAPNPKKLFKNSDLDLSELCRYPKRIRKYEIIIIKNQM